MHFCESLTPTAKQSETSAGAFDDAQNETCDDASQQHDEENTAEAMLVRTAANIAPDATWSQLFTLWPWPSFKDASLEAAFQVPHVCLLFPAIHSCRSFISSVFAESGAAHL